MGDKTGIEWTDATWNPVTGCTKVSQGCKHCYAERIFARPYPGRAFTDVRCHEDRLELPLRWKRPRRIFVNSMSDLFHDDVPFEFIDNVLAMAERAPQHTFQVLTKRPERMLRYLPEARREWWLLPNVWLGVSVEDQATADERIPLLLQTFWTVRWISAEPLLGPIDLSEWMADGEPSTSDIAGPRGPHYLRHGVPRLDWAVVGGESGPKARPMHPDWARALRDQCVAAGVPFLFKQWGEFAPNDRTFAEIEASSRKLTPVAIRGPGTRMALMDRVGKRAAGRELDGRTWDEYPQLALDMAREA